MLFQEWLHPRRGISSSAHTSSLPFIGNQGGPCLAKGTSHACYHKTSNPLRRGHGTYLGDEKLVASVAGVVDRVNKLVCVKALKTRYNGEVGDIVVGRITEVQQKRWKVETNSRLDSVLLLSSMNLPGGELRRRSAEDELAMRDYLQEGDLISAEVQAVFSDGAVSLHTRSLKYGKQVPLPDREVISRLRNCVVALVTQKLMLYDTTILYCYEASLPHQIKDLLKPEVMEEIVLETRQRLLELEG
ncbi:exosome complex component RRP4 isoform X3 [Hemicordylus capensis]|uniref:exosome complex component RRP4 isoform X3 n=1 Tax=Hemicordylus capensis TaxID=884348 RepID=UPI002303D596|nr:exosome complex component RRP4 isoform X3 [Hemicordylus capensis]